MARFAYNNAKNANTGYKPFELKCGYHLCVSYKEDIIPHSKLKLTDDLANKLREIMAVCQKNFYQAQKLQKQVYDKGKKPKNYIPSDKIWLNSKHLKTKQNWKLEVKFFRPFQVFYPVEKQAYKLELPKKWRIHDIFHVLLLKQDTTRKEGVDKNVA